MDTLKVIISFLNFTVVRETIDAVHSSVPLPIVLDLPDKYEMAVDSILNVLQVKLVGCEIPLSRKFGQRFLELRTEYNTLYTYTEPRKLHRNFLHPRSDKFLNLLKLARPRKTINRTKSILQDIKNRCDAYQFFAKVSV